MATSGDALKILQSLVKRTRNGRVAYSALITYAEKYLAKAADTDASLEAFADNPANLMGAFLVELAKDAKLTLSYHDGAITSVYYPDYYRGLIHDAYDKLDARPDGPFPTEDSLPVPIPNDLVTPVDIKIDFVQWLGRSEKIGNSFLRIMYPDDIRSMMVSSDLLPRHLPKLAVQKIRQYLRSEKNVGYIRSKLASVFRQREMAMKDMLSSILTTPDQALKSIFHPTDFTFHFWTQLSSTIIKEYSQKKDKLIEEHGHCQAAYMLGYYNLYHRGVLQRQREAESAFRQLESNLRRSPYTYTITEIRGFTDKRGVALTKKYSSEDVNSYITERLKTPDNKGLPDMVRIKTTEGKEYYLYKDYVLIVTLDRVFEARREFRDYYVDLWSESMKCQHRLPEMTDDAKFSKAVGERLKSQDPILYSLLNLNLLYLAKQESNVPSEVAPEIDELFAPKDAALRPLPEILNLDRRKLYADARLLLPFWQAIPILNKLVGLLKRIFLGRREEDNLERPERSGEQRRPAAAGTTMRYTPPGSETSQSLPDTEIGEPSPAGRADGSTRRAQTARFKEAVRQLQKTYVRAGSTPVKTLEQLIERWNPLLDPVAKSNLIEDINSLSRDFLRRMKVTFRLVPPNRERVEEWANRLAKNEAFEQIRRTDDLKEYLQLYILTVLGK